MNRIAVYSAIFGDRDVYREPPEGDFDAYLFTDKPVETCRAKVHVMQPIIPGDRIRSARMIKLLPHVFLPQYEVTLWMDGDLVLTDPNVGEMEKLYLEEHPIATFKHRFRSCAYDEAVECIIRGLDNPMTIAYQVERYRKNRFPQKMGLAETGVQLRRSQDDRVKAFCSAWWGEVFSFSRRDQLSFDFTAWQLGLKYQTFMGRVDSNPHFKLEPHEDEIRKLQTPA